VRALAVSSLWEVVVPVGKDLSILGPSILNFDSRGAEYAKGLGSRTRNSGCMSKRSSFFTWDPLPRAYQARIRHRLLACQPVSLLFDIDGTLLVTRDCLKYAY
jgi:hypothetical protein